MIDSYLVLLITSICCSLLGVFLVLRDMSMIADAIAHSVLLGIVIAFFITQDIGSMWLLVGAAIFGVITVAVIELIGKSRRVARSDAIGVVFPMFFSLAVVLISRYARNVHIDTDVVLMGEVIFTSLDTVEIGGIMLPTGFIKMLIITIINIFFILIFYKPLKISSFDEEYAILLGIPIGIIFYGFMTLTSLTAVMAFDSVGSILVLSFFITPAATSYIVSKDLKGMLIFSVIFSIINCTIGTVLAIYLNSSLTGMCAFVGMMIFIIVVVLNKKGILFNYMRNKKILSRVRCDMFVIHIGNHLGDGTSVSENGVSNIHNHLVWSKKELKDTTRYLIDNGIIYISDDEYKLTDEGIKRYDFLQKHYKLDKQEVF